MVFSSGDPLGAPLTPAMEIAKHFKTNDHRKSTENYQANESNKDQCTPFWDLTATRWLAFQSQLQFFARSRVLENQIIRKNRFGCSNTHGSSSLWKCRFLSNYGAANAQQMLLLAPFHCGRDERNRTSGIQRSKLHQRSSEYPWTESRKFRLENAQLRMTKISKN